MYLFATKTCPNCKIAASLLDRAGIAYEKVYAEENEEMAVSYGVRQAPTLVVIENGTATLHCGVSDIRKFIESK